MAEKLKKYFTAEEAIELLQKAINNQIKKE